MFAFVGAITRRQQSKSMFSSRPSHAPNSSLLPLETERHFPGAASHKAGLLVVEPAAPSEKVAKEEPDSVSSTGACGRPVHLTATLLSKQLTTLNRCRHRT